MQEINKVLEIANNEVGYLEKTSNSQLDSKTANAGRNNYTKYARDMDSLKVYNGPKQGYAWCNVFIDWCFVQAFGIERARELLIGFSAGCTQDFNWFKNAGQVVSSPQRGDLIFFGDTEHIGIVEKVTNGRVYTIEGNTSSREGLVANGGAVAKKSYLLGSSYICGYARPKYNANEEIIEREEEDMVEYQNGSTVENVYETSSFSKKIGSLNKWEKCKGKKISDGIYLVLYQVDGTNFYKSGFVRYDGGIR